MANAGLGDRVTGSQAGLNEPLTMFEKAETANTLRDQGWDEEQIANALGGVATPDAPEAMSTLGLLPYGARNWGESILGGVSGFAEDRFGADGLADGIDAFADWVGPSEEQEQAKAARDAERGTLGQGVDAAVQEAPGLAATIGAGAAVGAGVGAVGGPAALATGLAGGVIAGIGWLRIRDENRDAAKSGKAAMVKAKKMFGPNPTAEQIKEAQGLVTADEVAATELTDDDINKIDLMSAVSAAPEAIAPLRIFNRVAGKGGKAVMQGVLKKAVKEGGKDALTEGMTEVGQTAVTALAFDPALRAKMDEAEVKELAPWVLKYHGKEAMISFIAGAGLGGAAGGTTGAYEQAMTNAKTKSDIAAMTAAADLAGLKITDLEQAAGDPKKAEAIRENAPKLAAAERRVRNAEDTLTQADLNDEAKAEVQRELARAKADQREAFDAVMPLVGGKTFDAAQTARQEEATRKREQAIQRLNDTGEEFNVKADVDLSAIEELTTKFEEARATRQQAERSVQDAATPKGEDKAKKRLRQARDDEAEARAEIAGTLEGKDPDKERERVQNIFINQDKAAARSQERQAEVTEEREAIAKSDDPTAAAQQLVSDYEADLANPERKKKPQVVKDREDRDRLQNRLAKAKGKKARKDLRNQIDALDRKIEDATPPAVVAAREALLEQGIDPTPEAEARPTEGEAAAEAPITPETEPESSDRPKDQAAGKASAEPAVALAPEEVAKIERAIAKDEAKVAKDEAIAADETMPKTARNLAMNRARKAHQRIADNRMKLQIDREGAKVSAPSTETEPKAAAATDAKPADKDKGFDIDRQYRWKSAASELDGKPLAEVEADLRSRTADDGVEWSASFDADGNLLGAGTNGHVNGVSIPANMWNQPSVTMTHTHPHETPPSLADIRLLAAMGDDAAIRAVTPTKNIEVRKTPETTLDAVNAEGRKVHDVVKAMLGDGTLPPGMNDIAFGRVVQEALMRHMETLGLIDYAIPMDIKGPENVQIENILDRVAAYGDGLPADVGAGTPQGRERGGAGGTGPEARQAAGSDPVYPEFREQWASGVSTEELIQRPEFKAAVGEMMTRPATSKSKQPVFDSDAWHASRQYTIDGQTIVGTEPALERLIQGARDLAAKELKKPTKPVAKNRKLTIITGPPASGKSTIANEIAYDNDAAIIDSDEYKKALPEFGNGEGANAVHTESKALAGVVEGVLMGEGANVVYPKVGHEKASIDAMAKKWKDAGYEVKLVDLKVPSNEAMRRMLGRFADSGRLIPPSYLLDEVGDRPSAVHQQMAQENLYDGYAQLDGLTPYGQTPGVLAQSGAVDPLAGTKFQVSDGPPAQRGQPANEPGTAEDTQQPSVAAALDPYQPPRPEPIGGDLFRSVNEAETMSLAQATHDAILSGRKNKFSKAIEAGKITPEGIGRAIAVASDNNGQNAGVALRAVADHLFESDHGLADNDRYNMALGILNEVSNQGEGRFVRDSESFYDPAQKKNVTVSTLRLDKKLKDRILAAPEVIRFTPPMTNPNDVSEIKRKPGILLEGPALERAENTARIMQRQRFQLDQEYIAGLTPEDLLSAKNQPKNEGHRKFLLAQAGRKLRRLQDMAADWGDAELGFQYFIDKKGRMYPRGEFHHQSGDVIKAAFKIRMPDGSYRSLKEFNSVDHTGSGWQIAGYIARDDVLAPLVNMQAGTATIPGDTGKGDIYGAVREALGKRLSDTFGPDNAFVKKVINNPESGWSGKLGRNILKTPVIAVNYAGEQSNFRTALMDGWYSDFDKGELPDGFWHTAADIGYEAVGDIAPATKAFKDWAVAGLRRGIEAANSQGNDLEITVGPDGRYRVRKNKKVKHSLLADDNRKSSTIKQLKASWSEPGTDIDIKKTARNMFSQIIQGYDAAIMHETARLYDEAMGGQGLIVTNHDSYTVPPENAGILAAAVRQSMSNIMGDVDPAAILRQEILDQTGVDIGEPPAKGSYDPADISTGSPVFIEENEITGQAEERPPYTDLQGQPLEMPTPAAAMDVDEILSEFDVEPDMHDRSSIRLLYSGHETPVLKGNKEAAEFLQDKTPKADQITNFKKALTPQQRTKIAKLMAAEAMAAMRFRGDESAADWYTSAVARAMDIASIKYPMMLDQEAAQAAGFASPEDARFAFLYVMAVTSQNLDVRANATAAIKGYDQLLENIAKGDYDFGEGIATGNKKPSMQANLDKFGTLFNSKPMQDLSPQDRVTAMRRLFNEKKTIKEWETLFKGYGLSGFSVGQTKKSVEVYGSAFLGPKIGNGFYQNLAGNYDPITIDLWARRMWGRMTGKNIGMESSFEEQRDRLAASAKLSFRAAGDNDVREALKKSLTAAKRRLKAAKAEFDRIKSTPGAKGSTAAEKARTRANQEVKAIEAEIADVSNLRVPEPWKAEYAKDDEAYLAYAGRLKRAWDKEFKRLQKMKLKKSALEAAQPTWAMAAKSIVSSQTTPLDQVNNGTQRMDIEATMREAIALLRNAGVDITPADLQAILWYPEKDLWGSLSKEQALDEDGDPVVAVSDLNESYDTVLADILEGEGYDVEGKERNASGRSTTRRAGPQSGNGNSGGSGRIGGRGGQAVEGRPTIAAALDNAGDVGRGYPGEVARGGSDVRDTGGSGGRAVVDGPAFQTAARAALDQMGSIAAQVGTDAGDTNILMDGGKSGYALRGDNIISVFSSPDSPPNVAGRVLADGVARGGRRLDGFDTFLPGLYAKNGFRAVARLPFDPEYAPTRTGGAGADWDYQEMSEWNDGRPDVVFMVYDPDNANADTDNVVADYDAGIAAQDAALADMGEGQIDMVPTPAAGQDIVNALGETIPLQYLQLPRGVDTLANRISSVVDREAKAGRPINMGKVMHDIRTDPDLTNYAALAETATKLDGGKNGPTYKALLKRFNRELAGALKGRSIMAAGRDMQARLQQELAQHTADKMRPSIAFGIDTSIVQAAPKMEGIAQPVEYKTPERIGSAIFESATNPGGTFDKIMRAMSPALRKAEAAVFNKQSYLKQIEKLVGKGEALVSEGMSRMAQMMTANTGRQAMMMTSGGLKWNAADKIFELAEGTKGLEKIFQFNGVEDYQKFQGWAYAKRDRDLQSAGKAPRMTEALRAKYEGIPAVDKARYDAMLDDYKKFNASLRDLMQDSGLIDSRQKEALAKENEYVPMYRVFDDPVQFGLDNIFYGPDGFSHPDPGIKRLSENPPKVGEENGGEFGDLLEGIHNNAIAVLHAASQNIAHQQAYNFMSENLDETKPIQVKKLGKKAKKAAQRGEETNAFKFMKDGKEFYWKAKGDPEWTSGLALAISGLSPPQLDGIDRALKKFNNFQRSVITSTPSFAIRSVIRDAGQAYVQSGTNPLDIAKRNASMLKESWSGYDRTTQDLMAAAGVGGYQMQGMPEVDAASLRKRVKAQASGRWHQVRKAFGAYEQVIGGTELAARTSIYDQQIAKGVSKADAAYEALNMIDYNRAGAARVVQKMTYMVLFLNPRLQGLYRLFETTAGDGKNKWAKVSTSLAARGLVLMGLGLGLRALTAMDDEAEDDYKQLSVADRSTYYHIPLHSMGMDRFLRLPKPFELGAVFSTLPVAGIDAVAMGPQGLNDLGQMASHVFMETFSLNPTPQAVRPVVETMLNQNMFTGREIEGMRLQGLPKALRADLQTGGIAKALGNKAVSPAQIQHLLRGYLGPLGMFLYDSVDATMAGAGLVDSKAARSEGVFGGMPPGARELSNFTAKWMFSANEGERGTKYVGEFYDLHSRIRQYTAAINEASRMGDVEEVRRLVEKSKGIMPLKSTMNKVSSQLTKLNQAMRQAQLAPGLTDQQRQQQIDRINRAKNKLVRNAMEMARQYGVTGSFGGGLIGDTIKGV